MQSVRKAILGHACLRSYACPWVVAKDGPLHGGSTRHLCAPSLTSSDRILAQVIRMVKKYDRIDADKVTEMADFRKDLCLDSLDRVELVMAIEQEFNVEIPDEKADQLTCCADVVKYIVSEGNQKLPDNSCSEI